MLVPVSWMGGFAAFLCHLMKSLFRFILLVGQKKQSDNGTLHSGRFWLLFFKKNKQTVFSFYSFQSNSSLSVFLSLVCLCSDAMYIFLLASIRFLSFLISTLLSIIVPVLTVLLDQSHCLFSQKWELFQCFFYVTLNRFATVWI